MQSSFLLVLGTLVLILLIIIFINYRRVNYNWLSTTTRLLILSYPFERIPSLDTALGTLRISQILVALGFLFFLILVIKKDPKVMNLKIRLPVAILFLFILFSLPSWYFTISLTKFLSSFIATLLVFGAFFLISNFATDIKNRLRELMILMFWLTIFSFYQFFGDLAGLPITLTGLRDEYTKRVFGIPRVHATSLEPLYFAGMQFISFFTTLIFTLEKQKIFLKRGLYWNIILFLFFLTSFFLTLSKGAWLSISIILLPFTVLVISKYRQTFQDFFKVSMPIFYTYLSFVGFGLFVFLDRSIVIFNTLFRHLVGTFNLRTFTAIERLQLIDNALRLLYENIFFGIGSGQFGPYIGYSDLIVNNVYIEIWLEFGFISFVLFLVFLFIVIFKNLFKFNSHKEGYLSWILFFSLTSYLVQWNFFSPIFIMPIFILLGVMELLNKNYESKE